MPLPPLFGLVLAGGASTRMGQDKAALAYHGHSQLQWTFDLVSDVCAASFVSVRPDQRDEPTRSAFPQIVDLQPGIGPIAGITAALQQHPKAAWLVVACDLPFITREVLANLIDRRDPQALATAYRSHHDGLPEPLCATWEPTSRESLLGFIAGGKQCPRKFLINSNVRLIDLPNARALDNVNTSEEARAAREAVKRAADTWALDSGQTSEKNTRESTESMHSTLASAQSPEPRAPANKVNIRIQYYALFREQAGRSEETLETSAATPEALYRELRARYPFQLAQSQLKVAVNADFRDWDSPLVSGDSVVFIPPVAGG